MRSDDPDIDLIAAALRSDAGDLRVYLDVLASKLEAALPEMVAVERRRQGLLGPRVIARLTVSCGDERFILEPAGDGSLRATRAHIVRGIVLDRDELDVDGWVSALSESLGQHARQTEAGRQALGRLLA
jgi:hypothetical protein